MHRQSAVHTANLCPKSPESCCIRIRDISMKFQLSQTNCLFELNKVYQVQSEKNFFF